MAERLRPFGLLSYEQPIAADDWDGLARLTASLPEDVMVDESLCSVEDARRLAAARACSMFNVRVSKCGGPLAALEIVQIARAAGLRCQLGAQVGESGILTAAGRLVALLADPPFRHHEGADNLFLLRQDLTVENLTARPGGRGDMPERSRTRPPRQPGPPRCVDQASGCGRRAGQTGESPITRRKVAHGHETTEHRGCSEPGLALALGCPPFRGGDSRCVPDAAEQAPVDRPRQPRHGVRTRARFRQHRRHRRLPAQRADQHVRDAGALRRTDGRWRVAPTDHREPPDVRADERHDRQAETAAGHANLAGRLQPRGPGPHLAHDRGPSPLGRRPVPGHVQQRRRGAHLGRDRLRRDVRLRHQAAAGARTQPVRPALRGQPGQADRVEVLPDATAGA